MIEKVQYESDELKICAPNSLTFIVNDIVLYFHKQYDKVLNFYHLKSYGKYQINLFDDKEKFRNFVINDLRDGNNNLPDYAVGTYDKGMCNQFIELRKDDKGIYVLKDGKSKYISDNVYRKRVATPVHEFVHIIYLNYCVHGNSKLRVVWLDEGLAQNLSDEYDDLEHDFNEFVKFYNKVKNETKYIPKLEGIKHGNKFKNDDYDLYKLSYLAVKYLLDTMTEDEVYNIVMDYNKSNEIGKNIMADMFKYFDNIIEKGEKEIMIKFVKKLPSVTEYLYLYNSVNWGTRDKKIVEEALKNSIFGICAYDNDKIVAMSRVIGDKTIFMYVQDVIVASEYQNKGIGKELMTQLVKELKEYRQLYPGMRVYLGASKDKEAFYEKFGFVRRSNSDLGEGMILK